MISQYFFEKIWFGWLYRDFLNMRQYIWPHTVYIYVIYLHISLYIYIRGAVAAMIVW
jgi:hypothetical protein